MDNNNDHIINYPQANGRLSRSRRSTTAAIAARLFVILSLLSACSDNLSELIDEGEAEKARRGVYVNLSTALQQAIAIPNSQTEIKLHRVAADGSEREETLVITGTIASVKPPFSRGEHNYHIQIWYRPATTGSSADPLLLAEASKSSSKLRVEFSANELYTTPYDRNGDGIIDAAEKADLNFDSDGDGLVNLIEILEYGNPQNSAPTFVSAANIAVPENDDTSGYILYRASAISPRTNVDNGTRLAISYGIDVSYTDSRVQNLLLIDPVTGELATKIGKQFPAYDPIGDNVYTIALTAVDTQGSIGDMRLTLTITDIFNLTVSTRSKALLFQWEEFRDNDGKAADYYTLLQDINGTNNFIAVTEKDSQGNTIPLKIENTQYAYDIGLQLSTLKPDTQYKLEAYRKPVDPAFSATFIETSTPLTLKNTLRFPEDIISIIGYLKASNARVYDWFGSAIALSADGSTLAVGAIGASYETGTVYVFKRQTDKSWVQQANLKASNSSSVLDDFGVSVALSADGSTLAVGATGESSGIRGPVNDCGVKNAIPPGTPTNCESFSGAVYVFQHMTNNSWVEQSFLKASNAGFYDLFGSSVALSADGSILAVGAKAEDSGTGVNGGPISDCAAPTKPINCLLDSGAAYVFQRLTDNSWSQQAYLKASNAQEDEQFSISIALNADGNTLAVGTMVLGSSSLGGGGGAVYVFQRQTDYNWLQRAYLKTSKARSYSYYGGPVALSANGSTLAVGASQESSNAGGPVDDCDMLNADPPGTAINCLPSSGAVYLFNRQTDNRWLQQAYLKASDAGVYDYFGGSVALSADGSTLAVGARRQRSDAGANGGPIADCDTVLPDTPTNCKSNAGATYVFQRHTNDSWSQQVYLKAPNAGVADFFGQTVALSADGVTVAVGATGESSDTGVNGGPVDDCLKPTAKQLNCQWRSGAVYIY